MPNVILATAGYDHTIRLWEARNGFCYRTLQFNESQANQLEITPNKKYLAAAGNLHIKLFELASNNPNAVSNFSAHKSNVTSIGFEKQGEFLYSGSEDGTIKIWDPRVPNYQREFVHTDPCNTVELHPNQNDLISGHQNGSLCVYDLRATKKRLDISVDVDTSVRSLTLTDDGTRCCLVTNKGECFVWKVSPESANYFEKVKTWQAHNAYVLKCLYSPDMQSLATCSSDKTVRIWSTEDYSLVKTLQGHNRWVWDCVFSSTSEYLVTASSDNMARLWDIKEEKSIIQYAGHHKAVVCVALNDVDYASEGQKSGQASSSSASSSSPQPGAASKGSLTAAQQAQLQQQQQQQAQARLQQQQQRAAEQANAQRMQFINAATRLPAAAPLPPVAAIQAQNQAPAPQAAQPQQQQPPVAHSPDDDGSLGSSPLSSADEGSP
jgi:G protein beta subunit-like protein